jgi:hypothetical protein
MKRYVIELGFETNFYPPLNREQKIELWTKYLFAPLKETVKKSEGNLRIEEELTIIGKMIIEASEEVAKTLRKSGFKLTAFSVKKAK